VADDKIVARVRKLLAVAAPTSGASQNEREMAALEAAKLIAEHGVAVGAAAPAPLPRRSPARAPRPAAAAAYDPRFYPPPTPAYQRPPVYESSHGSWARTLATRSGVCVDPTCRGVIMAGDSVWQRRIGNVVEYLHADGPCRW
jgi:hypothetical protein